MAHEPLVYDVYTNADPAELSDIQLHIFRMWAVWATGGMALGGKILRNPTGKYASSIRMESHGLSHVGILADENIAPEAGILESGHPAFDLKDHLQFGRTYPIHYGGGHAARGVFGAANSRGQFLTGFARIGPNTRPDAFIIPAMSAYQPGLELAKIAAKMAGGGIISW